MTLLEWLKVRRERKHFLRELESVMIELERSAEGRFAEYQAFRIWKDIVDHKDEIWAAAMTNTNFTGHSLTVTCKKVDPRTGKNIIVPEEGYR